MINSVWLIYLQYLNSNIDQLQITSANILLSLNIFENDLSAWTKIIILLSHLARFAELSESELSSSLEQEEAENTKSY